MKDDLRKIGCKIAHKTGKARGTGVIERPLRCGKMGIYPLDRKAVECENRKNFLHAAVIRLRKERIAEPPHATVAGDVYTGAHSFTAREKRKSGGTLAIRDHKDRSMLHQWGKKELIRKREKKDGGLGETGEKSHTLLRINHRKGTGTAFIKRLGHREKTVPVSVGFQNAEDFFSFGK
jgi:hypothetical protein